MAFIDRILLKVLITDLPLTFDFWFGCFNSSRTLDIFKTNALVIIFESQFDKVIGLQFLISLLSLLSFGNHVITNSLCDTGYISVVQLCFQEFRINGPTMHESFF